MPPFHSKVPPRSVHLDPEKQGGKYILMAERFLAGFQPCTLAHRFRGGPNQVWGASTALTAQLGENFIIQKLSIILMWKDFFNTILSQAAPDTSASLS